MNRNSALLFALALVTSNASLAMTGGSVAAVFHGQWVPAKASCNSPLKLVIEPNTVTLINGAQRAVYPKLEQCFTCMGRDVTNIVLLSTDAMGDSPFMIHLDTRKKQPVLVDFSNDKKLGARFPFGSGALKKCA